MDSYWERRSSKARKYHHSILMPTIFIISFLDRIVFTVNGDLTRPKSFLDKIPVMLF